MSQKETSPIGQKISRKERSKEGEGYIKMSQKETSPIGHGKE